MSFNINKLRTDRDAEKKGVWVEAGAGLRLLIARLGNPEYNKYLNTLLRPLRAKLGGVGEINPADIEEVTLRAIAEHILLGWENLTDTVNGEEVPVPYSKQKALELLQIPDFAEIVTGFSRKAELFRLEQVKSAEGN